MNCMLDTAPVITSVKEPGSIQVNIRELLADESQVFGLADISF